MQTMLISISIPPLDLTSIGNSCLNHSLLQWLQSDDFLTQPPIPHLPVITQHFTVIKGLFFYSFLFTCSFIIGMNSSKFSVAFIIHCFSYTFGV